MRGRNLLSLLLKLLIVTLGFALFCKPGLYVTADLEAVRLLDDGIDTQVSCHLSHDLIDGKNRSTLTGLDPNATCRVQVTTSTQFHVVLIQVNRHVPPGTSLYIKRRENLPICQKKYMLITADEGPCYAVVPYIKRIVLQGNASVVISDIAIDHLPLACQENQTKYNDIQKSVLIDGIKVCPAMELNHSISCTALSNDRYSCEFLSDCFIILRNKYVEVQCSDVQSSHSALLIYPGNAIALDLSNQEIVQIAENAFSSVSLLRELYIDDSKISEIHPKAFADLQILTVLSLSNGKLSFLARGALKGLINLEKLRLNVNQMTSLEADLFNETRKLEYLVLTQNKLTYVPSGLLKGLINLKELHLFQNDIISLPADLFNETSQLEKISFNDNEVKYLPKLLFKELINLKRLYLHRNKLTSLEADLFNETRKLEYLTLYGNILKYLPSGLFNGLINLQTLKLYEIQLNSLEADLFNETRKLEYVSISGNNLTYLPSGLFHGTSELEKLYLRKNKLEYLPKLLFKGLINLKRLYLHRNKLTSLEADLFNETRKLEYLTLNGNILKYLPSGLFNGLINLKTLKLYEIQLNSLEADLFNETRKLEYLSLSTNNLTYLPSGLFHGTSELETLYLQRNKIASLSADLFNETRKLEHINIGKNNLTRIPYGLFKGLVNLEEIHLDANQLSTFDRELLTGINNLKELKVTENKIISLEPDLFNETRNLERISLSVNKLRHLPNQLFRGLHKLEYIFFYGNMLTSLDSTLFQGLSNVKILEIHSNKFRDINYDVLWDLKALESFGVGNNQITHLDPRLLDSLTELKILKIYRNRLHSLDKRLLQNNLKLEYLDLKFNQLKRIPNLEHLTHLAYLNLMGNRLTMIDQYTFSSLPKQVLLIVNQTEICECYVPNYLHQCTATDVRSPYLTCERLMSDRVLMAMTWIIGLNAIGGNVYVISRRWVKEKGSVQTFLLSNLAMSDLLMGVYMIIIVSADIYFGEYFPMQAEAWRTGTTCRISGALSLTSSEASVLFLVLITIDRFINIRFPYSQYKLSKKSSATVAALIWLISTIIGMVPSILAGKNDEFYDNSHVCIGLPLAQIEHFDKNVSVVPFVFSKLNNEKYLVESKSLGYVPGLYYASAVFLGLNSISFIAKLLCYIEIIRYAMQSSKKMGVDRNAKEIRMAFKVAGIVLTDFFCWGPIIILGILVQCRLIVLPASVFAWCITFVLPINSAINPYLYTIAAVISDRRKKTKQTNNDIN